MQMMCSMHLATGAGIVHNTRSCMMERLLEFTAGHKGEDEKMYRTVQAVGMELCPELGITIPVGKDSLSMATTWQENGVSKQVISPVSLIISAFAPVQDVRQTFTPVLQATDASHSLSDTELVLIDLGRGKNRLAGSILAQVLNQTGCLTPDLDSADDLKALTAVLIELRQQHFILAYHDRSDGGLLACIAEMAFATHCGISLNVDMLAVDSQQEADYGDTKNWAQQISGKRHDLTMRALFNEELGVVIQIRRSQRDAIFAILRRLNLSACSHVIGKPNTTGMIEIWCDAKILCVPSTNGATS